MQFTEIKVTNITKQNPKIGVRKSNKALKKGKKEEKSEKYMKNDIKLGLKAKVW